MFLKLIISHLLLFASISCSLDQNIDVQSYIESLHRDGNFNGNILVMQNDTVVYHNSLGYARGDKSEQLDKSNLFQVGSIYKEFPAVSIMQLKENGLLTLDDAISKHIKSLPEWSKAIKIKHLLQYSSGLPLVDWSSIIKGHDKISFPLVVDQLSRIEELSFEPGTDYIYSNYNPFLLIQIIENVTQLDFADYLEKNILKPHGIDGITLSNKYPYEDISHQNFAYPFDTEFKEDDMAYELPSICASTEGMYQWYSKLDNFEIISKASMKVLSKEVLAGDNIQSALGRGDWKNDDLQLHLHHGSTGNYECLVRNYKQDGITIILLTNQKHRNLHDIADKIHGILN